MIDRGVVSVGSVGSMEPMDIWKVVLESTKCYCTCLLSYLNNFSVLICKGIVGLGSVGSMEPTDYRKVLLEPTKF